MDTIRRDLDHLAERQLIARTHGGAMHTDELATADTPFDGRAAVYHPAKQAIGIAAARLIANGETLIVNGGTTTLAVARALTGKRDLTVVTNNLRLPAEIPQEAVRDLYINRGSCRIASNVTIGPVAFADTEGISADTAVIGVGGISTGGGLSTSNLHEAQMMRQMIDTGTRVIVVADSSKFGNSLFRGYRGLTGSRSWSPMCRRPLTSPSRWRMPRWNWSRWNEVPVPAVRIAYCLGERLTKEVSPVAVATGVCCAPIVREPLSEPDAAELAVLLKAVADPVRLRLLSMIGSPRGRRGVRVRSDPTPSKLTAPTISHHLKVLRTAGLIDGERRGTWVYYRIIPEVVARLGELFSSLAGVSVQTRPKAPPASGGASALRVRTGVRVASRRKAQRGSSRTVFREGNR